MTAPPGINLTRDQVIEKVRTFLGDTPEDNRLIPDVELSNNKLNLALDLALDEYNHAPPFENRTVASFPSLIVLIHGTAIQALIMAGMIQSRNYLNFNDGRFSTVFSDKAPSYQSWIANLVSTYQANVLSIKTALNMEENFGVIPSPYGNTMILD